MMVRYLGLSEEEMIQNTKMWQEETGNTSSAGIEGSDMRSIGITPGGLESDMAMAEMPEAPVEEGMEGVEGEAMAGDAGMTPGAPEAAPAEPAPV